MGKVEEQQLHGQQLVRGSRNRGILCESCSTGISRIGREFSLRCVIVLIFSLSVFLFAMYSLVPPHSIQTGFEAKEAIKLSAKVQASFRLQKPVPMLISHIERLEYDIYGEIGVPDTKVAILSMHQSSASNWTDVVFGVLPDPVDGSINPVYLSLLKSSLLMLFLQESNLMLNASVFGQGQPSSFEILKFSGGITWIPEQPASVWQMPQILFNFTLPNSIDEIKDNFSELKEQLKLGLHLRSYENVYVQITNSYGSTRDPPVIVQASVMSDLGSLLPQRLKQLAQVITGSPPGKNLGLDHSVFGKVKEVSLSSFLKCTLHATPPTPSPALAPEQDGHGEPSAAPYPGFSPSHSPAPWPDFHHHLPRCFNCEASSPSPESGPIIDTQPLHPCPYCGSTIAPSPSPTFNLNPTVPFAFPSRTPSSPSAGPITSSSPDLPPLLVVSYGFIPRQGKLNRKWSVSPPHASPSISVSVSSFASRPSCREIWLFGFCGLLTFHLLWWS